MAVCPMSPGGPELSEPIQPDRAIRAPAGRSEASDLPACRNPATTSASGKIAGMSKAPEASVLLRTTPEQRDALHAEAREQGLSLQELLELKLFGVLRPRERRRRRPAPTSQEDLPLGMTA